MKPRMFVCVIAALVGAAFSRPSAAQSSVGEYCKSLPGVVRQAVSLMPADKRIPCDAQHIVIVPDLHKWVVEAAHGNYDSEPRYKAIEKELDLNVAFTFGGRYPVYLNLSKERMAFIERDTTGPLRFSCMLQHEYKHANDHELRESVAYQVEVDCLRRYEAVREVPTIAVRTAEQYRDYFKQEEDRKAAVEATVAAAKNPNGGN